MPEPASLGLMIFGFGVAMSERDKQQKRAAKRLKKLEKAAPVRKDDNLTAFKSLASRRTGSGPQLTIPRLGAPVRVGAPASPLGPTPFGSS